MITSPNGGSGLPSSGQLLDHGTGLPTPVSLTVAGGSFVGDAQAAHGANPMTDDAFTLFSGIVSGQGALSYINQAGSALVLTFTGLDPSKVYDLAYFAHRNKYAWSRASLVTLSAQAAFTNSSSVATDNPNESGGVLFTGPTDTSTRLTADNDNGYVARFSNINPCSDGRVVPMILPFQRQVWQCRAVAGVRGRRWSRQSSADGECGAGSNGDAPEHGGLGWHGDG